MINLDPAAATGRMADLEDCAVTMWSSRDYECDGHPCIESGRRVYCRALGLWWDKDEIGGEGE